MKKFIFKMQRMLDFKKRKEDELIKLLAVDTSHVFCAKKGLELLYDELDSITEQINEIRNSSRFNRGDESDKNAGEVMNYYSYSSYLKEAISNQKKKIKILELKFENDRNKLIVAIKERKIFEKLKEHQYNNFVDRYIKLDQKETDEIASRISNKHIQRRLYG